MSITTYTTTTTVLTRSGSIYTLSSTDNAPGVLTCGRGQYDGHVEENVLHSKPMLGQRWAIYDENGNRVLYTSEVQEMNTTTITTCVDARRLDPEPSTEPAPFTPEQIALYN